jgi:DNA-binding transcriptional regulator YhcF (GntR family)
VSLPFSHRDLAGLIGISPEHLSRVLRQLTYEGVIRRQKGWIIVTEPHKLAVSTSLSSQLSKIDIYRSSPICMQLLGLQKAF